MQVKTGQGVKLGWNTYMDELCSDPIKMEQDAPTDNDKKIPCLFWLDDFVLISTTEDGLNRNCFAQMTNECKSSF